MNKSGITKCFFQLIVITLLIVVTACTVRPDSDSGSNPTAIETSAVQAEMASQAAGTAASVIQESTEPTSSPTMEATSPTATASAAPTATPVSPAGTKKPAVKQSSPKPTPTAVPETKGVKLSIIGDEKTGVVLEPVLVEVEGEISVISLLQKAARAQKIPVEFSGKGIFAYVKGIDNLYEYDRGVKSGWLFKINGEFASKGAGSYNVKAGDQVEWLYTLDLGKDIGNTR